MQPMYNMNSVVYITQLNYCFSKFANYKRPCYIVFYLNCPAGVVTNNHAHDKLEAHWRVEASIGYRAVQWHYIEKLSNDTVPNHTLITTNYNQSPSSIYLQLN